ncbi:MAG: stage II sporulation protein M [Acidobacteriota bacterium]
MDYRRFVELREPACAELEKALATARRDPKGLGYDDLEAMAFHYRQVLHDHSLAQARFPGTAMARRLQRLVLDATHWLQRDDGATLPSPRRFLVQTFPRAFQSLLGPMAVAAALFVTATLFGFTLTVAQPGLASLFLPPEASAGLARGELWTDSIFSVTPHAVASGQIATNNMKVAIVAWAGGAIAGFGALWVLVMNGLMLGAVLALVAQYSMAGALLDFIAAHGPLELSLIVVSAGAGLHMGRALVVADDQPRSRRLRAAGKDALVVLLGALPWILVLGFVEGFLSPSDIPFATKAAVGLLLEAVFLGWAFLPAQAPAAAPSSPEVAA